jgi:uncharacterized membrane protein YesL
MKLWSYKSFLMESWTLMSKQFFSLLGASFIGSVVPGLIIAGGVALLSSGLGMIAQVIGGVLIVIGVVAAAVFSVNITRFSLLAAEGAHVNWRLVTSIDWSLTRRFWGTSLLLFLIVLGGLILLIVPGVIFALKYGQAPFIVIDKDLSGREALRESAELTQGMKKKLFWWGLFTSSLVGITSKYIGSLIVGLWTPILSALIYRQLVEQAGNTVKPEPTVVQRPTQQAPMNQYQI